MSFQVAHRTEKLLEIIIHQNGYVTSEYLSEKLKVSPRTIREDIKQLSLDLNNNGITLAAVPSKGYCIPQEDLEKAFSYLHSLEPDHSELPTLPHDRIRYILRSLLFTGASISIPDLVEDLFISNSTAEKDLQEARKWLESNNLLLSNSGSSGFCLEGSELSIRYAMVNYFWSFHDLSSLLELDEIKSIFTRDMVESVEKIIYGLHDEKDFYLSDADYLNLILYLSIIITRTVGGFDIAEDVSVPVKFGKSEKYLASAIAKQLSERTSFQLSQIEIDHLARYLAQMNIVVEHDSIGKIGIRGKSISDFIADAIDEISAQFKLDLREDEDLANSLASYLDSMIKRKDNQAYVKKLAIEGIAKEYPVAFEMAVAISEMVRTEFTLTLEQNEIEYIALYFCAAIERLLTRKDQTREIIAVIICATGAGGSQLLAAKFRRQFPDIHIAGIYPSHRLNEAREKKPDLIITTIPLADPSLPVIQISHLLTRDDHDTIRKAIDNLNTSIPELDLSRMFQADLFFNDIKAHDWQAALTDLCAKIEERGYVGKDYIESVLKREAVFPTAIGNLVAIPHAFSFQKGQAWIAAGILKEPVHWGDEMVQLILLLNIDHSSEDDYKKIFETLYEKLSVKKYTRKLIASGNFESFMKEINE